MVSVQANRPGLAIELLTDCLKSCQDPGNKHALDRAHTLLAMTN
jgi:hypothetical protein